jgi:muconate cycloisomerase
LNLLDSLPRERHAAFCAAELAALDLLGRITGRSAGEAIGPIRTDPVIYSGIIAGKTDDAIAEQIQLNQALGVQHVKIKVGESLERNMEIVKQARRELGDDISLRIDANCAWTGDEGVRQLQGLARFRMDGVEQPTPSEDIEGLVTISQSGAVPVVVDESLCSKADARALIDAGACDIFNIRISKCGGLSNAARLHEIATEAGLRCQLGAQVGETGILSAAGRHYATRSKGVLWCEGSFGKLLLEEEIMLPDIAVGAGGVAHALTEPGLGVTPDPQLLERFTTHKQVIFSDEGGTES